MVSGSKGSQRLEAGVCMFQAMARVAGWLTADTVPHDNAVIVVVSKLHVATAVHATEWPKKTPQHLG